MQMTNIHTDTNTADFVPTDFAATSRSAGWSGDDFFSQRVHSWQWRRGRHARIRSHSRTSKGWERQAQSHQMLEKHLVTTHFHPPFQFHLLRIGFIITYRDTYRHVSDTKRLDTADLTNLFLSLPTCGRQTWTTTVSTINVLHNGIFGHKLTIIILKPFFLNLFFVGVLWIKKFETNKKWLNTSDASKWKNVWSIDFI